MNNVIQILISVGAIMPNDHFVGTSGRHLEAYINKDALYPHTKETSLIGAYFAEAHKGLDIHLVAGPAMGGIILSQWTARHLSELKEKEILSVYAEKKEGVLTLTRGYDALVKGKNVLVVEDLTTTGGSLAAVIDLVKKAGGSVLAASVMVNRDPEYVSESSFGVPFTSLAEYRTPSYTAEECPMCKQNMPINLSLGHGAKFLAEKK
ncbi:MAG: phosphoribosyltransferase [Candidatus Magasanikbacteria bacterium]|nr:phosphoribosyltransferase [Candidatus Magasanikbacteria bacterium]